MQLPHRSGLAALRNRPQNLRSPVPDASVLVEVDLLIQEVLVERDVLLRGHRVLGQPREGDLHGLGDLGNVFGTQPAGKSSSAHLVRRFAVPAAVEHRGTMRLESSPRLEGGLDLGPRRPREPRKHGCGGGGTCHARHPESTGADAMALQAQVRVE